MNKLLCFLLLVFVTNFQIHTYAQSHTALVKLPGEKEPCDIRKYYWIIYDNVCPYCKQAAKHIKELDWERKFKFISYRDPMTYKMFPELTKEECEKDVHMVTPDGRVLIGYKVFRTIIDNLAATKILDPLLHNDYAEKQLNEIYEKMVAKRTCYYDKGACKLKKKSLGQKE